MNQSTPIKEFFVVGGTMSPDAPSYVVRQADDQLYCRCVAGDFCYLLTPRQMGKSSLMTRTANRLKQQGVGVAIVDLSGLGTEQGAYSAGKWYYGIAHRMVRDLAINIDLSNWWRAREELPAVQRLTEFFADVVLEKSAGSVVIFVDEIDTTIGLPFTDDFFAAIRACYNARATQPGFGRLSFVLLGVATPSQLIKDTQRTPFNIGHQIELTDFTLSEALPLAQFLGMDERGALLVLKRIMYWSGGHPYLTQKLCRIVAAGNRVGCSDEVIDGIVADHFLTADARRSDSNLSFVRDRLLVNKKKEVKRLKLYHRIVKGYVVGDEPLSATHATLKLSGVAVVRDNQQLQVRNRIYERIFSIAWVKDEMPINWNKSIAVASIVLLFLSFLGWYLLIFPQQYINAILRADLDIPNLPYEKLRKIPGYAGKADTLLADYWDRRALRLELEENRDYALLYRLKALEVQDTETRRREVGLLVGDTYRKHKRTYQQNGPVISVAFSPDGKILLTGSYDGYARLWNVATGLAMNLGMKHGSWVTAVAFSPDGKILLTGCSDGFARLWNTATGQPRGIGMKHERAVIALAFSSDGKTLLTSSSRILAGTGSTRLWNAATGQSMGLGIKHNDGVTAVAFSPDGKILLTGSAFGYARMWNAVTGQAIGVGMKHEGRINAVAFSPDGKCITVVTLQWIHQSILSGETFIHRRSRLLPHLSLRGSIHFPNDTADRIQVAVRVTGNSLRIITLQMDKLDAPPIQGNPAELLRQWQEKLGLKLKDDGKIEPLYPLPRQ